MESNDSNVAVIANTSLKALIDVMGFSASLSPLISLFYVSGTGRERDSLEMQSMSPFSPCCLLSSGWLDVTELVGCVPGFGPNFNGDLQVTEACAL